MAMFEEGFRPAAYEPFVHPTPGWFQDAKLGIFLHWGAYSVPAWAEPLGELSAQDHSFAHNPYAEWYANTIRIAGSPAQLRHEALYGAGYSYYNFLDEWRAERFDASSLARTVAATGARYFVPVTKHHDGIALWEAPGSEDVNTVARGPKRDLVAEMAEATRATGLRFGVYYSGGLDWRVADEGPISEERGDGVRIIHRPNSEAYARYAYRQALDLVERFAPDLLWGDIEWPDAGKPESEYSLIELFKRFYAANPAGVINDRFGDTHWDFRTTEYQMGAARAGEMFEHCRGLGLSFGYNQVETHAHTLSGPDAVRMLADVVSRGGNLLLNIGLTAEGELPRVQRETLEALGQWNDTNGRAIFGSHPFVPESAPLSGSPWMRWTRDAEHLYAITDAVGEVVVPVSPDAVDAATVTLLPGVPLAADPEPDGIRIVLPPSEYLKVVALKLS